MIKILRNFTGDLLATLGLCNGRIRPKSAYPYTHKNLDYEWRVGLPWYLQRIEGSVIFDGGCAEHLEFDKILCRLGFRVFGVDIAPIPSYQHPYFNFIQKVVWSTGLESQSVDCVVANSLLEHLGLPYYKQPTTNFADKLAMSEFKRVLKPDGLLLMQVPFGLNSCVIFNGKQPFYRVYTTETLNGLLEPFKVEDRDYFIYERGSWIETNELIASKIRVDKGLPPCLCYVSAKRKSNGNGK